MCDTFVALGKHTADGSVILGKNSDRDPNEAQLLEYHPPRDYAAGSELECTHISIPQARHTHGVLVSRPHWCWGAEMGGNERGLAIGNEAVFTRMHRSREPGLIGLDLLRLALERADTARGALETITELLARYGQGGMHSAKLVYHNSFIIADPADAWVLETAGELWAAKRVAGFAAISNGLTLGEEMDDCSPNIEDRARELGLHEKGRPFHFSRCLSDRFYTTFSACAFRRDRSLELLRGHAGTMSVGDAFRILRDHGGAGAGYRPDRHLLMRHLCAHAANSLSRDAAQSTGSLVAHLRGGFHTFWVTGTSAPCTGVFKPVWLGGSTLPEDGQAAGAAFDADSPWWRHELVHRRALRDLPRALALMGPRREALESELLASARETGGSSEARFALTLAAFQKSRELDDEVHEELRGLRSAAAMPPYRAYWRRKNREAGLPADV